MRITFYEGKIIEMGNERRKNINFLNIKGEPAHRFFKWAGNYEITKTRRFHYTFK